MPGPMADAPEEALQRPPNGRGGGLVTEDCEAHDAPRAVVDGHDQPPAEWPHLRQGAGSPGGPEPKRSGNGGEIDVPEVIRPSGGDSARRRLESRARLRWRSLPQHSTHRRGSEVETGAGVDLCDLDLPQGRAENLEASHEVADEVGKLVHRLRQTDEGLRPDLVEALTDPTPVPTRLELSSAGRPRAQGQ